MSVCIQFQPLISCSRFPGKNYTPVTIPRTKLKFTVSAVGSKCSKWRVSGIKEDAAEGSNGGVSASNSSNEEIPRWEILLGTAASLYPVYVTVGGVVACVKPETFSWFVKRGPGSFSFTLGLIMLAMGITLELREFFGLFMQRPLSILFGFSAQYMIMPTFGFIISKLLGLSPALSVGLILLGCCPGGTASNVDVTGAQGSDIVRPLGHNRLIVPRHPSFQVTLIARGDVALSIVMTVCTTLGAVILTPLLTKILAGTYVPVDTIKLSISTLQVVVAPILIGSYMQSTFPAAVKVFTPFAPLLAVLASSLLACSVFSQNVVHLKSSIASASTASASSPIVLVQQILSGEFGAVILSVLLLHFAGFFVGYLSAKIGGFEEPQRRAIAIEVGMQNSSLGVVLATSHFTSPMVALPPAMSAVIMNIMGSTLGVIWRHMDPSNSNNVRKKSDSN